MSLTISRSMGLGVLVLWPLMRWRLLAAALVWVSTMPATAGQFPQQQRGPTILINPRETVEPPVSAKMAKERNRLRQKKLESQMKLLRQLTIDLHTEVNAPDKEVAALEVVQKTEQIEKLAKSIRQLMIGPL